MTDVLIKSAADWISVFRSRISELGLSHLDVDGAAGLSEGHTSKILCGLRKPSAETIARLCAALGLVQMVKQKPLLTDDRPLQKSVNTTTLATTMEIIDGETLNQFSS
jgi:hypothetical protein